MSESKLIHNHLLTSENDSLLVNDEIRYDFRGDYLGFTFDGVHSSKLGIVRTSDGNKYNENLTPTFSDITATVPGLDETYYFGSNFTQATTTIKFSFDSLTDTQIRKLKRFFSQKEPKDLIFDEVPYKVYSAKPQSVPTLSYLCFDDGEKRIYKGEGTITFVVYSPFARSRFKYLDDYTLANIPEWKGSINDTDGILNNKEEWKDSSGLVSSNSKVDYGGGTYEIIDVSYYDDNYSKKCYISLHNLSDFEASPKILAYFSNIDSTDILTISLGRRLLDNEELLLGEIKINIKEIKNIKGVVIDSASKLIYPLLTEIDFNQDKRIYNNSKNWNYDKKTIYNKYIVEGNFFNIPVCSFEDESPTYIYSTFGCRLAIDYKYLYY